jgi:hypothetical protein
MCLASSFADSARFVKSLIPMFGFFVLAPIADYCRLCLSALLSFWIMETRILAEVGGGE